MASTCITDLDKWEQALSTEDAASKLQQYTTAINATTDMAERKRLLREMLDYAIVEAGIPVKGVSILGLKNANAGARGDWMILEEELISGNNVQLNKILDRVFHEGGHSLANRMSSAERERVFSGGNRFYFPGAVNSQHYRTQPQEVYSHHMGNRGKALGLKLMPNEKPHDK